MGKLDINLLAILEAVYDEGSITRAADRLCLSQPAVSHALNRLRSTYNDPLFSRQGQRMQPSPLTERIIHPVKGALRTLRDSVNAGEVFDPAHLQREFRLGLRDGMNTAVMPSLLAEVNGQAPDVAIASHPCHPQQLEESLAQGSLDLVIDLLKPVPDVIKHARLMFEPLCVVGRPDHPALQQPLDLTTYLAHKQVLVSPMQQGPEWVDHELARHGLRRTVGARCHSYLCAAYMLRQSDYLSIIPRGIARIMNEHIALAIRDLPLEVPTLELHAYWHERADRDPAHRWFRQRLLSALETVPYITLEADAKINLLR